MTRTPGDQDSRVSSANEDRVWASFFEQANTKETTPPPRPSHRRALVGESARAVGRRLAAITGALRAIPRRRVMFSVVVLTAVAGAVALVVAGIAVMSNGPAPATPTPTPTPTTEAEWCPEGGSATGVVTTSAAGDSTSGSGVVSALEYAYYVQRSGAAVRALIAPGAPFNTADNIQANIDQFIPAGTSHCAVISPEGGGVYALTLRERQPDGREVVYQQEVRVAEQDGRYMVASVTKAK